MKLLNITLFLSVATFSVISHAMILDPRVPKAEKYDLSRIPTMDSGELTRLEEKRKREFSRACQALELIHAEGRYLAEIRSTSPRDLMDSLEWDYKTALQVEEQRRDRNSPDSPFGLALMHRFLQFNQQVPEGVLKPIAKR